MLKEVPRYVTKKHIEEFFNIHDNSVPLVVVSDGVENGSGRSGSEEQERRGCHVL